MKKRKLLIIVLFQNLMDASPYYARNPAPPLPGILLAGMTPPIVDVEVLHEMVRPIDYTTDAQFIALSFMDYLAPHAYEVAAQFRALGKTVIGDLRNTRGIPWFKRKTEQGRGIQGGVSEAPPSRDSHFYGIHVCS